MQQTSTNLHKKSRHPNHNLTDFVFFKNTPLTDYNNTIHFKSNKERDDYFLNGGHFEAYSFTKRPFNFIRDRLEIRVPLSWQESMGVNYCTFLSDFEDRRYYAFINAVEYINDETVAFTMVLDTVMTFMQGHNLEQLTNVNIQRQHLPKKEYENRLTELRNNDDVIKASNKKYMVNKYEDFGENYVLFQSSADLRKKFGTKKDPNLESSQGTTYDHITSPVDLYLIDYNDFNKFMDAMSKFPWITQNFQKIQLIPKRFFDNDDLEQIDAKEKVGAKIYTLKKNKISNRWTLDALETSFEDLRSIIGVQDNDALKHMVRNEYMTVELYDWDGGSLLLDAGLLPTETGLKLNTRSIIGYHNEVRIYPVHYKSGEIEQPVRRTEDNKILVDLGAFLNESMTIDTFAQVPILIDNGTLQYANRANKRQLTEARQPTNRMKNVFDDSAGAKERMFDAYNVLGNLNPMSFMSKFNDEYETYRDMQAEDKDLALQPPQVTGSEMGNAFQIANNINGVTLKIGCPNINELSTIMKYYLLFGYDATENGAQLQDVESMTICNYVKMTGTIHIDNTDPSIIEQLKSVLETGVRLWHNDGSHNPMAQDPLANTFKE